MPPEDFAGLVAGWTGGTPPRVWSLLVTVFGDMAQGAGDSLTGAQLRALIAPVGISAPATRTALHRLKKDGWIDSTRSGRATCYALTPRGRTESAAASPRIYGTGGRAGRAWVLVAPARTDWPAGAVPVAPGVALSPRAPTDPAIFATEVTPASPLPGWMRDRAVPPDLCAQSRALLARVNALRAGLAQVAPPDALQACVLRVLIVHDWRRIALRAPLLPDFVLPDGWAGSDLRAQVGDLLHSVPRP